jgi:hypothetical protein
MALITPRSDSVEGAIIELEQLGFTSRFHRTDDGLLCCRTCGVCHDPEVLLVAEPGVRGTDQEVVVMPLVCPCCRERGTAVIPAATGR